MASAQFKDAERGSFLWVDFELTGLNMRSDLVIEVAAIATEGLFTVKDEFTSFVRYPEGVVESLISENQWWLDRPDHTRLMLDGSKNAASDLKKVAIDLTDFARETQFGSVTYLAGNSVYNDRRWIERDFPELENRLHYRMLDVSSFKLFVAEAIGIEYVKAANHRALEDIKESIDELKFLTDLIYPN